MTVLPDLRLDANDAWLAAAVEWLRLLLAHHIPSAAPAMPIVVATTTPPPTPTSPPANTESSWWSFRRTGAGTTPTPPPAPPPPPPKRAALPPASMEVTQQEVDDAEARMRALADENNPPALLRLEQNFDLSPFERDVLLLCVAMELDTRIAGLCARAHGDPALAYPTFGLAFHLFEHTAKGPHWDARSPSGALRFWRMVEAQASWAQPLTMSALRADERIVHFAKGLDDLDERVVPYVTPASPPGGPLPASQALIVESILAELDRHPRHLQRVQLLGRDSESKQLIAADVTARLGLMLYRMSADLLPTQAADIETLARLWSRETLLQNVALFIDAQEIDRGAEAQATALKRFLARAGGVLFVDAKEAWPVARASLSVDAQKPTPLEQRELWLQATGDARAAAELAAEFNLSGASIARIAADAHAAEGAPAFDDVRSRAALQTRMRVDALAQRIDAKATWADIVLPESELALLRQIAAHVGGRATVYEDWGFRDRMNRGFGISALFSGESGTGKTMAAEVIANDLGLPLHRIDLSSVVSKWVGETEKNLQQLFNAADDANGILFFDEADALFGKRTEVQQSQDRFANIEINFLLQRLESYRGLAILATNMKGALDTAFLRRLRFIVDFPFPSAELRQRIWERAFPPKVPKKGLDFERLSKLILAGGSIQNIVLASSFLAARAGTPVTMPLVLDAARAEMRKLEKPLDDAMFRWQEAAS